jgi:hypothetical protein
LLPLQERHDLRGVARVANKYQVLVLVPLNQSLLDSRGSTISSARL